MLKYSVIIPVYNVENYLHRCINSILVQEYTDLEILLIVTMDLLIVVAVFVILMPVSTQIFPAHHIETMVSVQLETLVYKSL